MREKKKGERVREGRERGRRVKERVRERSRAIEREGG